MPRLKQVAKEKFAVGIVEAAKDLGFAASYELTDIQLGFKLDINLSPLKLLEDQIPFLLKGLSAAIRDSANQSNLTIDLSRGENSDELYIGVIVYIDDNFVFDEKTGNIQLSIEALKDNILRILKKRRPKRKRENLPDPSKSHHADVNRYPRLTQQFKTDVEPQLVQRVDAFKKASGLTKREIVEAALELYLSQNEIK